MHAEELRPPWLLIIKSINHLITCTQLLQYKAIIKVEDVNYATTHFSVTSMLPMSYHSSDSLGSGEEQGTLFFLIRPPKLPLYTHADAF